MRESCNNDNNNDNMYCVFSIFRQTYCISLKQTINNSIQNALTIISNSFWHIVRRHKWHQLDVIMDGYWSGWPKKVQK